MEILKKKAKSYTIYKEEYNYGVPKYFMIDNNAQDSKIERINFDVDARGGIKIVRINETVKKLPESATLFLTNITSDFISVNVVNDELFKDTPDLVFDDRDEIFSILENKYLVHKAKYVSWDGVIVRVKFTKNVAKLDRDYGDIGTTHHYCLVDDISKDSH